MKLRPRAILFDMDGVLVDSLDSWWLSLNHSLKAFNHKQISKDEFIERYWGHDFYDNIKTMGLSQEIGDYCKSIYGEYVNRIRMYPGTKYTLQKLKRYKKGIITNTPKDCTYKILNRFSIEHYFDTVITSDDVAEGKPNPEIIFTACHVLNVDPKTVVLVGDTESDVQAGRGAGCIIIGINIEADYTIKSVLELSRILDH